MIFDIPDLEQVQDFIYERKAVYFRLTGGFGNQLFGLSEAFRIHKIVGRSVAIDVGSIEHTPGGNPEWLEWAENQDWLFLVRIPKGVSCKFPLTNLGNVSERTDLQELQFYTGWKFSLKRVKDTGLFTEGEFPFKSNGLENIDTAVHYRVGDYSSALGIGVLELSYYVNAISSLNNLGKIEFFSDDNESAQKLIDDLKIFSASVSTSVSALEVLARISSAKCIVAANSTLSWWGIYFSQADNVICPKPFYLQDWKFDDEAIFNNALYISRFNNPLQAVSIWLIWRLRSIRIRNKQ